LGIVFQWDWFINIYWLIWSRDYFKPEELFHLLPAIAVWNLPRDPLQFQTIGALLFPSTCFSVRLSNSSRAACECGGSVITPPNRAFRLLIGSQSNGTLRVLRV
jgi:hypothetical protein